MKVDYNKNTRKSFRVNNAELALIEEAMKKVQNGRTENIGFSLYVREVLIDAAKRELAEGSAA